MQDFVSAEAIADRIIADVGKTIVLGLPLGLGKANHIVNALYARAAADRSINLSIFTALTLEKPRPSSELEKRFINPVIERLFGGYPDLAYAKALHANALPPNIEVNEFFFLAGRWLNSPTAQQNYISANYTHAFNYLLSRGVNVVAQLVAKRVADGAPRYSLSCNTDITVDLLKVRRAGGASFRMYGQVNAELPFMPGDGDLPKGEFAGILESPEVEFPLFAPPAEPISDRKYAIGLHVAGLVRDGGTLQIGIGQIGDALAQSLIVRHRENAGFLEITDRLHNGSFPAGLETAPFERGLYGVSEMFVEPFLKLIDAGIIKREAEGALLHAAFFLGPKSFYRALREMPQEALNRIQMKAVSFTNEILDDADAKRLARIDARFVNNVMMATLLGAAVSDGIDDGRIVSGVGGQYNFVAQAFALAGCALDPGAGGEPRDRIEGGLEHSLVLRPSNHSTASTRRVRHRIRRGRRARQIRPRRDRGDAGDHGFALPGRVDPRGQGRRQAGEGPRDSARASREFSGADRTGAQACARCRRAAVISIWLRLHRGRTGADSCAAAPARGLRVTGRDDAAAVQRARCCTCG